MKSIKNRWLIAASAVGVHVSIGAVYAYSVLKKPLFDALGWNQSQTTWAFSLAILFLGLSASFLGPMVERLGPRKSGMLSALFYCGGLAFAGIAISSGQLWLFYLGYGVIGGIGLGVGYISPVSTLIKWFPDRRGLATGLATMGFGFGALLAGPVMQVLIKQVGLSSTLCLLAGVYLVVMMASARYIEPPPPDWTPDGGKRAASQTSRRRPVQDLAQLTSIEALGTARFYYLWVMLFINVACGIAVISVASPMSQEIAGLTSAGAATMVGLMGLFNGLGRIGWASVSDYLGRPATFTAFFLIQMVAFFVLPWATHPLVFQALIFIILSCYGGGFALIPAYIGDIFGTKRLSAILGNVLTAWAAAGLFGPLLAARVRESTGNYEQTLQIFAGLFVIAIAASILIQLNIRTHRARVLQAA